jgi:hypothetical protein
MSPLDIRSAILAKLAPYVVLTHFPIALFLTRSRFRRKQDEACDWGGSSVHLLVAAVSVPPVVASGILAWQWQLAGQSRGVSLLHLVLGCVSGWLICVGLVGSACGHGGSSARYLLTAICSSSSWPFL